MQVHVTDPASYRPVLCAVAVIRAAAELYPDSFAWLDPPYEYETEKLPIDIIYGGPGLREGIGGGMTAEDIASSWMRPLDRFLESRAGLLIYD